MTAPAATQNPLLELTRVGQSVWYDYLRRSLISSGELARLIAEDGLRGMTSNPSIFEKAITGSTDYDQQLAELRAQGGARGRSPQWIFEQLALRDIADAADAFRPVFDSTGGADGFVSIEVSPTLAHDTDGTIAEAERLWKALDRPNVMVKVPATPAGLPAIRELTARGVNVNITLLFGIPVYEQVAEAYLSGLEALAAVGGDLSRIASVASFFVSRIDVAADALLAEHGEEGHALEGKVAIANAKLAYERYKEIFAGERWERLAAAGAHTQRLLWASTSTKSPSLPDVYYVEALIGPETIDTVPPATFDAFRDHGRVALRLEQDVDEARDVLDRLARLGISLDEVTDKVLADGVRLFEDAFAKLLAAVEEATGSLADRFTLALPAALERDVDDVIGEWDAEGKVGRLWRCDSALWTGGDESQWLGWLGVADKELANRAQLEAIARDAREGGFTGALLLGMGGSSLAPEVLSRTFGHADGSPALHVLDSTDPAQVRAFEEAVDLARTLFVVSSKSGTTLEPNILRDYFYDRAAEAMRPDPPGAHFVAITDPGSALEEAARRDGFRHVAHGLKSIGGRYSALSSFGMVPGAIAGIDAHALLERAQEMAHACSPCVPARENPGLLLGAAIGAAHNAGRDKLTIVASPGIRDFGAWLEQLLAESTGKQGRGVIPVDREPLGPSDAYGDDRIFAYARLASAPDAGQDAALDALARAGHPVLRIELPEREDLGGQFFQWELATAVAGAIIGINPFDQPDVEASKVETRKLTDEYERTGSLPPEEPFFEGDGVALFGPGPGGDEPSLAGHLRAHLDRLGAGDYFALLAYVQMTEEHERELAAMRQLVRDRRHVATCVGFGPRFLHSTGQAYKGGPNSGVFLQLTCDDARDLPVPGRRYSFGVVKAAQARGDFEVLLERGRRALRVHLGADVRAGLELLRRTIEEVV